MLNGKDVRSTIIGIQCNIICLYLIINYDMGDVGSLLIYMYTYRMRERRGGGISSLERKELIFFIESQIIFPPSVNYGTSFLKTALIAGMIMNFLFFFLSRVYIHIHNVYCILYIYTCIIGTYLNVLMTYIVSVLFVIIIIIWAIPKIRLYLVSRYCIILKNRGTCIMILFFLSIMSSNPVYSMQQSARVRYIYYNIV